VCTIQKLESTSLYVSLGSSSHSSKDPLLSISFLLNSLIFSLTLSFLSVYSGYLKRKGKREKIKGEGRSKIKEKVSP
jgi:hypothetical protein